MEDQPGAGAIRIGVEIEGGSLKLKWKSGPPSAVEMARQFPNKTIGTLRKGAGSADRARLEQISTFEEELKRHELVRSDSFEDLKSLGSVASARGVSIHAELASTVHSVGTDLPAELVSTPHLLTAQDLQYLKTSVRKALLEGKLRNAQTTSFQGHQVESQFQKLSTISGSIQTTVGVAADKLLSDHRNERTTIVEFLTERQTKQRELFGRLVDITCSAPVMKGADQGDQKYRFRLMLLMCLLNVCAEFWKVKSMEKDAFGANIKGYSSNEGCGVTGGLDIGSLEDYERTLLLHLSGQDLGEHLLKGVSHKLGRGGLSAQVFYEKGQAIPCFLVGERLHTVIEARQKDASINTAMLTFLRSADKDLKPDIVTIGGAARAVDVELRKGLCMN